VKFSARYPSIILAVASAFAAPGAARAVESLAPNPADARTVGDATLTQVAAKCHFHDGEYTGAVFDAYYGDVQVKAIVQNGCVASIDVVQYPNDRRTSRRINDQALPMLESEVIEAQSGKVDIVTGATLTSRAYIRSLRDALGQAGS
jgi:uncharacterized protein with FMN-binding domain